MQDEQPDLTFSANVVVPSSLWPAVLLVLKTDRIPIVQIRSDAIEFSFADLPVSRLRNIGQTKNQLTSTIEPAIRFLRAIGEKLAVHQIDTLPEADLQRAKITLQRANK